VKEEAQIKRRLEVIKHKIIKCDDLIEIWKLKDEYAYLTRKLNRLLRKKE